MVDVPIGALLLLSCQQEDKGGVALETDVLRLEDWARRKIEGRELIAAEMRYG